MKKNFTEARMHYHEWKDKTLGVFRPTPNKHQINHPIRQNNICLKIEQIAGGHFLCKLQTETTQLRLVKLLLLSMMAMSKDIINLDFLFK